MKKIIFATIVIYFAALIFNSDFYQPRPENYDWAFVEDHRNVLTGYYKVHHFSDTLEWFRGFIGRDHASLRPVACYLFYAQIWLGIHVGYEYTDFSTFLLFLSNCLLIAAFTYQITRAYWPSLMAGIGAAHVATWLPTLTTQRGGLPFDWFYLSDNTLVAAFMLMAMIAFLAWREHAARKYLCYAYLAFVLACLTKEQAYILPCLLSVLCLVRVPFPRPARVERHIAALQPICMALLVAALYAYRAAVLQHPHNPPHRLDTLHEIISWFPTPSQIFLMDGPAMLYWTAIYIAIVYTGFKVCHECCSRSNSTPYLNVVCLWAVAQLCYLPALGLDIAGHRGMLAVMLKGVALSVAISYAADWARMRLYRLRTSPSVKARFQMPAEAMRQFK